MYVGGICAMQYQNCSNAVLIYQANKLKMAAHVS